MKLIIDIPEELAEEEHWYTEEELWTVIKAAENGTPLDDVKAEIRAEQEKYSHPLEIERAIEILDNIGKAESEVKPNDKRTDKSL